MRSLNFLATGETGSFRRKLSEADGLSRVSELLTLLTLGLFRPFAVARQWRYKAEHFAVLAAGSLDEFIANQEAEVRVTGEEATDLLDVDLGL